MAGLSSEGFVRKSLTEILESIKQGYKDEFGDSVVTTDDSVLMQIAAPIAIEANQLWLANEAAYNAYTIAGAEGIHLDNIYNGLGIVREDAAYATDKALLEISPTAPESQTILTTTSFTDSTGNTLFPEEAVIIGTSNTFAYKIEEANVALNTSYTLNITDSNGTQQTTTLSVTDSASKTSFFSSIKTFIETHREETRGYIVADTSGVYIGYSDNKDISLLPLHLYIILSPAIGVRYSVVNIKATTKEKKTLSSEGDTYSVSPAPSGMLRCLQSDEVFAGREIETDAEYTARVQRLNNTQEQSSAASILTSVSAVEGVNRVRLYQNPSPSPITEVDRAYAFHVITEGGVSKAIGEAIFKNMPVNVYPFGTTSVSVTDVLGNPHIVRYSKATSTDIHLQIEYSTASGSFLTATEQNTINSAILEYISSLAIGESFSVFRTLGIIINAITETTFTNVVVQVKGEGGSFSATDFNTTYNSVLSLPTANITYSKV